MTFVHAIFTPVLAILLGGIVAAGLACADIRLRNHVAKFYAWVLAIALIALIGVIL